MRSRLALLALCLAAVPFAAAAPLAAGEVEVVDASARHEGGNRWHFEVTLKHADEGWDHYADRWDVLAPDGKVLGTRVLYHPHVNEQPFTRSLSGVEIPPDIDKVTIRGHDKVHGTGGPEMTVELPR